MAHLLLRQNPRIAKARHIAAGVVRVGVVDAAPRVFDHLGRFCSQRIFHTANAAVFQQAGALVAIADLAGADLMAGIAVGAVGHARHIAKLQTAAVLGDL